MTKAAHLDALEWRPVWLKQFLDFCRANNLPVDFVSAHPYPTDWALDELGQEGHYTRSVDSTCKDLGCCGRSWARVITPTPKSI